MTHLEVSTAHLTKEFKKEVDDNLASALSAHQTLCEKTCLGQEMTGWYNWPEKGGFKLLSELEDWRKDFFQSYDCIVVVGIGGSYAGTRALAQVLEHTYSPWLLMQGRTLASKPIFFAGQDLSETSLLELMDSLEGSLPLLIVVSKSGNTLEPLLSFSILKDSMEERFGKEKAHKRILTVTDEDSSGYLAQLSEANGLKQFSIPKDIGGRYSLFSTSSLLPLFLAGHNVKELMEGAQSLFHSLKNLDGHPVLTAACVRKVAWDKGKRVEALTYSEPKLSGFAEWWKQLFAESEGKNSKGLLPISLCYSTDLHSLGQYLQDGYPSILESFLEVSNSSFKKDNIMERTLTTSRKNLQKESLRPFANKRLNTINKLAVDAAKKAHFERGVPCLTYKIPDLSAFSLAYLSASFQVICALSALMQDLNPFDQPGVEAYKKHLHSSL